MSIPWLVFSFVSMLETLRVQFENLLAKIGWLVQLISAFAWGGTVLVTLRCKIFFGPLLRRVKSEEPCATVG